MKRRGCPSVNFTGSRSSNYYVKRIRKNDSKGSDSIKRFFKSEVVSHQDEKDKEKIGTQKNADNELSIEKNIEGEISDQNEKDNIFFKENIVIFHWLVKSMCLFLNFILIEKYIT